MNNLEQLVPKHKHDLEVIDKLRELDPRMDVSSIMDDLFEWLQDINWPVAQELCTVLPRFKADDLLPRIHRVLNSDDEGWQYSCIYFLIPKLNTDVHNEVREDLLRIIQNPTPSEILSEINKGAKEIYESVF
ncbi:hypothetical protein BK126_06815 [Paenibacillus sp. FSL H7-0326]|uniref:DUF5071 domain-containing protein n=1 Tax=Paenibacillus sp. FSL H7-0326 TaxID=1921144 RepID=UPI00096F7015|nr:DUF5071 domain-containing protein [Paenibacillus sp. FSL H7-0326]OMC71761.1 hypothetical protein BK126_06815 [Paenibacillus sp. FSL H7-0326]